MYIASVNDDPKKLQERIKNGEEICQWVVKKVDDPNQYDWFCGTLDECQEYAKTEDDIDGFELWQMDENLSVDYRHEEIKVNEQEARA